MQVPSAGPVPGALIRQDATSDPRLHHHARDLAFGFAAASNFVIMLAVLLRGVDERPRRLARPSRAAPTTRNKSERYEALACCNITLTQRSNFFHFSSSFISKATSAFLGFCPILLKRQFAVLGSGPSRAAARLRPPHARCGAEAGRIPWATCATCAACALSSSTPSVSGLLLVAACSLHEARCHCTCAAGAGMGRKGGRRPTLTTHTLPPPPS